MSWKFLPMRLLPGGAPFVKAARLHDWWTPEQQDEHINFLVLGAVFNGLKCFAKNQQSSGILLRVDNTTALAYINRFGSVQYPKLAALSKEIWQWCESRDL